MSDIKYTVYTYGGGEQLYYAFNAIASLFKHNAFESAFYIAAMMFGFWILLTAVIKNQPMIPIKWMFWFWIGTTVMLAPKTSVHISDPVTGYNRPVANVPYVLGAFAGMVSSFGHGMTEVMEMFYSIPDYQKYGENGSMFASKILKNMNNYRIRDGVLKENMERFIDRCVKLEALMGGKYTIEDLHNRDDIWKLVSENANPVNGFSYRDKTKKRTDIYTCKEAVSKLEADLNGHTKTLATKLGMTFRPGTSEDKTVAPVVFENFFNEKLSSSYRLMSGIAKNAEEILKQQMMINAIEDVKTNYTVSKAMIQQRTWHLTTGELAANGLVMIKIVLETLAYSGFIFVAIMVMLPTGVTILGRYLGILLWLQLWAPLFAVLNMVMSSAARYKTAGVLAGDGLTMFTSAGLAGLHADMEAIAAMCSASIPFISYALIQGGVGSFMHLAGTMTGALSGASQGAASEVTSGNLAMNTVSYGTRQQMTTTGFKHDTGLNYRSGRMEAENLDGTQSFMTAGGNLGVMSGEGINTSRLADKITLNKAATAGSTSMISSELSEAGNWTESYEKSQQMAVNQSKELLQSMAKNTGQNRGWQISEGSRDADSINKTVAFTKQLQESHGLTEAQAAEVSASLGIGIGKFGVGSSFSGKSAKEDALAKAQQLAESQGLTKSLESGVSHLKDVKFNESMGEEKRLSDNLQVSLNNMERASNQASYHKSRAERLQNMKNIVESSGIGMTTDLTERFIDFTANQKRLGEGKIGRAEAIKIATQQRGEVQYEIMKDRFFQHIAAEQMQSLSQADSQGLFGLSGAANASISNYNNPNQKEGLLSEYKNNTGDNKGNFNNTVQTKDDEGSLYGDLGSKKNKENNGQKLETPISDWFNNKGKELTTNSDVARGDNLKIHDASEKEKAQEKYQNYTPEGNDKPLNLVSEVRNKLEENKPKFEQQGQALTERQEGLNDKVIESAENRTLYGKLSGVKVEKGYEKWDYFGRRIDNNEAEQNSAPNSNVGAKSGEDLSSGASVTPVSNPRQSSVVKSKSDDDKSMTSFVDLDRDQNIAPKTFTEEHKDQEKNKNTQSYNNESMGVDQFPSSSFGERDFSSFNVDATKTQGVESEILSNNKVELSEKGKDDFKASGDSNNKSRFENPTDRSVQSITSESNQGSVNTFSQEKSLIEEGLNKPKPKVIYKNPSSSGRSDMKERMQKEAEEFKELNKDN